MGIPPSEYPNSASFNASKKKSSIFFAFGEFCDQISMLWKSIKQYFPLWKFKVIKTESGRYSASHQGITVFFNDLSGKPMPAGNDQLRHFPFGKITANEVFGMFSFL